MLAFSVRDSLDDRVESPHLVATDRVLMTSAVDFAGTERFEPRRFLGAGGFGSVYEALDRRHGTRVALKVLGAHDADALYRFKQEFRLLSGVVHPNLVTMYELVSTGPEWFFTMDLIPGPHLTEHLASSAKLDARWIRDAMVGLASGLATLHAYSILHLDLKPPNVRLADHERVVLLDFGLARPLASAARPIAWLPQEVAGSPGYMAPEQWWGQPLTESADWFAVGVMLYELLTGKHPFLHALSEMVQGRTRIRVPDEARLDDNTNDLASLCEDLLRFEAAARPTGAEISARLSQQVRVSRAISPPAKARSLIGRGHEIGRLRDAFAASKASAAVVHLAGAAGTGKSALLRAFMDELIAADEAVVLGGRCCERESVPYKALDGVLDALCERVLQLSPAARATTVPESFERVATLFPAVRRIIAADSGGTAASPDPLELRREAAEQVGELLRRLGHAKPVVIVIDDLQWGDVDSAQFLAAVLAGPRSPPVTCLLAYRNDEVNAGGFIPELERLSSSVGSTSQPSTILLAQLAPEDAARLATDRLGLGPAARDTAERIAREALGSPLLIEEFARHLAGNDCGPEEGELSLAQVVEARVNRLSSDAREALAIVAVAARPLEPAVVLDAARPARATLSSLALLQSIQFLRPRMSGVRLGLEVSHDRIRESIVASLDATTLAGHHRRLAHALEATSDPSPEELSLHLHAGGEQERAAVYALRAADRARDALAFARAADLYGRALAWGAHAQGAVARRDVERAQADALALSGRSAGAAPLFAELAESAAPSEKTELERLAIEHYLLAGRLDEGLRLAEPLLHRAGLQYPRSTPEAALRVLGPLLRLRLRSLSFAERAPEDIEPNALITIDTSWSMGKALMDIQPLHAMGFQLRSLVLALDVGEPSRIARALVAFGGLWLWQGTPGAVKVGTRYLERGAEIARRVRQPELTAVAAVFRCAREVTLGRWKPALALADVALDELRHHGREALWEGNMARMMGLLVVEATGDVTQMLERGAQWLRVASERGDLFSQVTATVSSALGFVAAGNSDDARRRLREALAAWPQTGIVQRLAAIPTEVHADLYEGAALRAFSRITESWPQIRSTQSLRAGIGRVKFHAARARSAIAAAVVDAQRRKELLLIAEADAAALAREIRSDAEPSAQMLLAGVAWLRGQEGRAVTFLSHAERGFFRADMPVHGACIRRQLGALLKGESGRKWVADADEQLRSCGVADPARWSATLVPGWSRHQ